MIIKKLSSRIILLCIVIFQTGSAIAFAQGPGEETQPPIVVSPSGRLELTLKQLGYEADTLSQSSPNNTYRLDLPGNLQILPTDTYLELITSHLPAPPDKTSNLDVELNKLPLATVVLTASNSISNVTRIDLPERALKTGRNDIDVNLNIGELTCDDPKAAIKVMVDPASTVSFEYQQTPYPADLALYPYPFTEQSVLKNPVAIVLPDQPTSDDLSAAATVAAGLGQKSGGKINLTTVLAGDIDPQIRANNHLIVVGTPDNNSLLKDLELPLPFDSPVLKPGQGILEEIVSPWNEYRLMLIVSGLDTEGVSKASQTLNRQANFLGMRGPVAVVLDLLALDKTNALTPTSTTLASLDYQDQTAYGTLPQEFDFEFTLPLNWRLEEPPSFVLRFTHADILDPAQSLIDVKLNRRPIGSAVLDRTNSNLGEVTIPLAGHLLQTGRNRLTVGVQMNIPDGDACRNRTDNRVWTTISSESEIILPYSTINLPADLRLFPYPFSQSTGFDQTLFVLPDQASSSIFDNMMRLAVRMGSASRPEYISARVAYASEVDDALRAKYHLILFGRPSENKMLKAVNASLPQPFLPDSDLLQPLAVDNVSFLPDPNRDAGLLEIMASPWNENHSILAITGTTDVGFRLAYQTLLGESGSLRGNLAVIEPPLDPSAQQPDPISTYSIDTRSSAPTDGQTGVNQSDNKDDLNLLAKRWWE